ncbi:MULTISPECIES: helix-turn-helix domain-containing protein [unclassified Gordonia (in: high G+C Gram-positive bacteria)]|uniref:AraC family transcriptional regulator n=1 Tax=unclassified Gordonia (in: high G+C Gram-positive bacteria) TaxID=2657482 RepID=UPI0009AE5B55|nr:MULTISPECIES: helix-turn-helix domain-containing protein [unclassified Gordonia (in: high G+C Gram-positive bacteria)]MDF3280773.1 AraC family transcriptional regulator [Gordonia sp. N1V]OPX11880.1 hypothetical protein B1964_22020 [Gordonia sp. i37]
MTVDAGPIQATSLSLTPLANHNVLTTDDLDEARASVGRSLCPHRLRATGSVVRAVHNVTTLGECGFHYIDYRGGAEVSTEGLPFILVQIPIAGHCVISAQGDDRIVGVGQAVITPTAVPLRMTYGYDNPRLMIRIDAAAWAARAEPFTAATEVNASVVLDLTSGAGHTWRTLLDLTLAEGNDPTHDARFVASLSSAVVDGLLAACRTNSDHASTRARVTPRRLRNALEIVESRCAEPLTVAEIAASAGLSVRELQGAFRIHLDTTPTAHVRRVRLDRARADLTSGTVEHVTDAATRWGFAHLGRFSRDYRVRYGETPSQTLRRHR